MFVLEHHDEFVGHVSGLVGSMATEFSFSVNSAEVAAPAPANGIPIVALANTAPPTTDEDAPAVVCGCDLFNWSVNPFMTLTNGLIVSWIILVQMAVMTLTKAAAMSPFSKNCKERPIPSRSGRVLVFFVSTRRQTKRSARN